MTNKTQVTKNVSFLGENSKEEFIEKLCRLLRTIKKYPVIEAYVFGSFFSNKFNSNSDLDLIIIAKIDQDFIKRPLYFEELEALNAPIDLLVYTPEEFKKISDEKKVGFWKDIFTTMKKII
jgi:predicted nucleotidyltransferase